METIQQSISREDQQFKYAGQDRQKIYNILQSIGEKVIEAESLKILIEMMRKIQNHSHQIIQTNGDVSKLKTQIQWFQSVLWYRRSRQVTNLQDLFSFCLNFFKGVDITTQLNVNCEVFQFHPIMKYLPKKGGFPLKDIFPFIQPYITYQIDPSIVEGIASFIYNSQQFNPQGHSQINPGPISPQSNIYPNSPQKPQQNTNPYQSHTYNPQNNQQFNNPYQSNVNDPRINPNQLFQPPNPYPQNYPQNPQINPNLPPQPQKPSPYAPNEQYPKIDITNSNVFNSQSSNPYETGPDPYQVQPQPQNIHNKPLPQKKPSLYSTIMKGPSVQRDLERQGFEREPHQQYGSQVPFNQQNQQNFNYPDIDSTLNDLNEMENNKKEEQARRERQEAERRKRQQEEAKRRREEQEQKRRQEEFRKRVEQELLRDEIQKQQRQKREKQKQREEDEEKRLIQELKKQNQFQKENGQDDDWDKINDMEDIDDIDDMDDQELLREAEERFGLESEDNNQIEREEIELREKIKEEQMQRQVEEEMEKQKEESEKSQEEIQLGIDKLDNEREMDLDINVFADNQREAVDRGASGRFSQNFGMKVDFGDNYEGEEFNYESGSDIKSSMLKFKTDPENGEKVNAPEQLKEGSSGQCSHDEQQSLNIIKKFSGCQPETVFKLFYFKRTE